MVAGDPRRQLSQRGLSADDELEPAIPRRRERPAPFAGERRHVGCGRRIVGEKAVEPFPALPHGAGEAECGQGAAEATGVDHPVGKGCVTFDS